MAESRGPIVALVQVAPDHSLAERTAQVSAPIGIAYLAAFLENRGVRVVHCLAATPAECELVSLKDAQGTAPDVVGISATGNEISPLLALARRIRVEAPQAIVVAGGYCSLDAESLLRTGHVDVVVFGEGEETLAEIVDAVRDGRTLDSIRGIAVVGMGGTISRTPRRQPLENLDTLPTPQYVHSPSGSGLIRVYSSRGCPFDCTFCRIKDFYSTSRIRAHGTEWVRELVRRLLDAEQGPVQYLFFNDDEFLLDGAHFVNMVGVAREFGLRICFQTRTADILRHRELLLEHRDSIYQVHMGVESFAQSQLDRWSKRTTVAANRSALELLAAAGISYYPYVILSDAFTTRTEFETNCRGILALPPCSQEHHTGSSIWRGRMRPLHAGLHFNRMKDLHGSVERESATEWLEPVWSFVEQTHAEAIRLAELCRYSAMSTASPGWFASGAALLEDRVERLIEIANVAQEGTHTDLRTTALADQFNASGAWERAAFMAFALSSHRPSSAA